MDSKKWIIIYYFVVFIFIGIPIWYKTTTPVRYKLPDVKTLMVHSQTITNRLQINVIHVRPFVTNDTVSEYDQEYETMKQDLTTNWSRFHSTSKNIVYEFNWIVRRLRNELNEHKLFASSINNLADVDEMTKELKVRFKQGNLSIYLLDNSYWNRLTSTNEKRNAIYGSYRSFYMKYDQATTAFLVEHVINILDNPIDETTLAAHSKPELVEAEIPKNVQSSLMNSKLSIYLNVMTERLNDSITFQKSDDFTFIGKMRNKLITELTGSNLKSNVISQMINNALPNDLIANNLIHIAGDEKIRLLDLKSLPELLNKIETRISPPSDKNTIEFNVIVPDSQKSKLFFYDQSTGQKSSALVTPYQPNTLIWNSANDFNIAFKSFVRKQLGFPFKQTNAAIRRDIYFAKWEYDNLVRQITNKQLSKTLESLESLEKLLNKISNIVIEEDISRRMFDAVAYAHKSIDELHNYGLSKALEFSSKAFMNSENAYYDPSLLSLLYFPENQKYAIYFPLFFPIAIQLASYFIDYAKFRFRTRKQNHITSTDSKKVN